MILLYILVPGLRPVAGKQERTRIFFSAEGMKIVRTDPMVSS